MTISAMPATPRADASALLAFDGPAHVIVEWLVVTGPGTVTPLSDATDVTGRAWAVYRPNGASGTATIRVQHGA
ncbi:hypothetical protein ED236_08305 [Pseudomethylobacillus aquaticus]|uniref:Uncharacterized protein n=1 Tax=Pseudomethylobacillus aquaticus TaxID=2676064 RepID=A0A3N0UYW7_9PROT|nr:hypothetical protein [Pseudomethylobacillus aquaticus]ROH85737.1 hypothetical protein ED236_08305 [Pseudomethylobacillus aquaticus]